MTSSSSQVFKHTILKAHDLLVNNQDPEAAIEFLKDYIRQTDNPDRGILHWLGLCYLENKDYENARDQYLSIHQYYQAGFCELLLGNLANAKELWVKYPESEVKYWSQCLETILEGNLILVPTFLNLRNHLETDLGYLLRAKQEIFSNKILILADDLAQINLEAYKFIGRSLLHNGYEHVSVNFLIKGQKILPNDPEIYYHLGQYSQQVGAAGEAKTMFRQCLLLSPSYSPAIDRLKEMKE